MKRISFLFLVMLLVLSVQARKKGKPVHLGRYDWRVTQPIKRRMPAKVPFSLYLDHDVLYVNAEEDLVYSVSFVDASENILTETCLSGVENELQVPTGTSAVLIYLNTSVYIAYL